MFPERIETDRLYLERISAETVDLFALHEFYSDGDDTEEMFEYWDSSPHETVRETADYIEEAERQWNDAEGAKYVIRPRAGEDGAGVVAGTTGLYLDWEKRLARLGILLDRPFWGRGYAGERADAMLAVAFERLGLEVVAVGHEAGNEKARRAIRTYVDRHGGRHEGLLRNFHPLPDRVADIHRYTISREEYFEASER